MPAGGAEDLDGYDSGVARLRLERRGVACQGATSTLERGLDLAAFLEGVEGVVDPLDVVACEVAVDDGVASGGLGGIELVDGAGGRGVSCGLAGGERVELSECVGVGGGGVRSWCGVLSVEVGKG